MLVHSLQARLLRSHRGCGAELLRCVGGFYDGGEGSPRGRGLRASLASARGWRSGAISPARTAGGDTYGVIHTNIHLSGYGEVLTLRRTVAKSKMVCRTPASGCHGYHVKLSSGASHAQSYRNST